MNTANPDLAKHIRKIADHTESPHSPITEAVVRLNNQQPTLDDNGIAAKLNAERAFDRVITRDYVKKIRHRYKHLWKS
ncbi:MAG: hypothetical protein LC114_09180 [Bryobacterales bacterium]|nr:hypothetical protein [Bryobacterales bacterium]